MVFHPSYSSIKYRSGQPGTIHHNWVRQIEVCRDRSSTSALHFRDHLPDLGGEVWLASLEDGQATAEARLAEIENVVDQSRHALNTAFVQMFRRNRRRLTEGSALPFPWNKPGRCDLRLYLVCRLGS